MPVAQLIPAEDEQLDHKILESRVCGHSVHEIAQMLGIPKYEVTKRLDRALPPLDGPARRRSVSLSLARLDELSATFFKMAKAGDVEAASICVRLECERRMLMGLTGSGYDPVQLLNAGDGGKRSTDGIVRALAALGHTPALPEPVIEEPAAVAVKPEGGSSA